jgi:hypothetical protein
VHGGANRCLSEPLSVCLAGWCGVVRAQDLGLTAGRARTLHSALCAFVQGEEASHWSAFDAAVAQVKPLTHRAPCLEGAF